MRDGGLPMPDRPLDLLHMPGLILRTVIGDRRNSAGVRRRLSPVRLRSSWSPRLEAPVFVVGAPRSGTTFLGSCLGRTPGISYHFEPVLTKAAAPYVYLGMWDDERSARFFRRTYRWLARLRLDGDLRFVEKTPRNAMLVPFLAGAFPDSLFIHIVRDGRDVALSWSEQPWLGGPGTNRRKYEPGGYRYGPHPRMWVDPERMEEFGATTTAHRAAWGWRRHVEAVLDAAGTLPPERYLEIRYEDLVNDPAAVGHRVLEFVGVTGSEAMTAGLDAFREVRTGSAGRWRSGLSVADLELVEREAGSLLDQLGYPS